VKPELLFENEPYRVVRTDCSPGSDLTIICFDPWKHSRAPRDAAEFDDVAQDNFVVRKGMNAVFVQTRRNDWYQGDGILDALTGVLEKRRANEVFIAYGTSMGGHAAASFADALEADFFFSASAQVSLCPAFMGQIFDRRWHDSHEIFRYDNILDGACHSRRGLVCYDSAQHHDRVHAERMLRETDADRLDCPGTWHFAARLVQREIGVMNLLQEIAETIRRGDALDGCLNRVKGVVANSFAARFMDAGGAEKGRIFREFGIARLQKEIHLNSLVRAFDLDPCHEIASILQQTQMHLADTGQKDFVQRMLVRNGYEDICDLAGHGAAPGCQNAPANPAAAAACAREPA
jgi:hypothetical protein